MIPTIHARIDDTLYFHGSAASRTLRSLQGGVDVSVCITLLDGIALRPLHVRALHELPLGRGVRPGPSGHRPGGAPRSSPAPSSTTSAAGRSADASMPNQVETEADALPGAPPRRGLREGLGRARPRSRRRTRRYPCGRACSRCTSCRVNPSRTRTWTPRCRPRSISRTTADRGAERPPRQRPPEPCAATSAPCPGRSGCCSPGTFINRFGMFVLPFLVLYLRDLGYSAPQGGIAVGMYGVGGIAAVGVGGLLADRIGRKHSVALSMFGSAASTLALSQAHTLGTILPLDGPGGALRRVVPSRGLGVDRRLRAARAARHGLRAEPSRGQSRVGARAGPRRRHGLEVLLPPVRGRRRDLGGVRRDRPRRPPARRPQLASARAPRRGHEVGPGRPRLPALPRGDLLRRRRCSCRPRPPSRCRFGRRASRTRPTGCCSH